MKNYDKSKSRPGVNKIKNYQFKCVKCAKRYQLNENEVRTKNIRASFFGYNSGTCSKCKYKW